MRTTGLLLTLWSLTGALAAQQSGLGRWKVRAALVLDNLEVRPVPLHAFRLVGRPDSALTIRGRTGLDGTAEGEAPTGSYLLISDAPARAGGVAYSWSVPIAIKAGGSVQIELTNVNATFDSTIVTDLTRTGRRLEDAVTAYRRIRRGVFRVESGAGHGSGFLVDSVAGLVITNAHVVANQAEASVVLDSVTRVAGSILARSEPRDVAVIRVAPSVVANRPALPLAEPRATAALVEPGERVFAIGYPLDQEQTLTTGIVSSIRSGAIISDVNINPGNSGGPMLNYSGVVVGINTFASVPERGPGIAGAVVATEIWPVLEGARVAMATSSTPAATLLPTMPLTSYSLDDLRSHADTVARGRLEEYAGHTIGPFEIALQSPVAVYLTQRAYDEEVSRDRRRREQQAGIDSATRYSGLKEIRDWYRFASHLLTPVVMINVSPKIGETTGSVLGRVFAGARRATYKYQGDVSRVRIYRNGVPWLPIRGGTQPVEQYVDNQWVSLKDVANFGLYVMSPLLFAPDTLGTPPSIVVEVFDLKQENKPRCLELPRRTVAYTWNDFLPYLRVNHPDLPPVQASANLKPEKFGRSILRNDSVLTTSPRRDWRTLWPDCDDLAY